MTRAFTPGEGDTKGSISLRDFSDITCAKSTLRKKRQVGGKEEVVIVDRRQEGLVEDTRNRQFIRYTYRDQTKSQLREDVGS